MENTGNYVVVVGGVNIDIAGTPLNQLIRHDSNPGKVHLSLGGVGRNIAHNISLLGIKTVFLTAFGDDMYAERIEKSCEELGIDISRALRVQGGVTSTYLCINDDEGDMDTAISDMEICEHITPEYIEKNLDIINSAVAVVMDGNLNEDTIEYLGENAKAPLFADPVSVTKAHKFRNILGKIHSFKPNAIEAGTLSGINIIDQESAAAAAEKLIQRGLKRVFISMGRIGVFAADEEHSFFQNSFEADMKNSTGAGDAFMSGMVWSYIKGLDIYDTAKYATMAAAINTEGEETINPLLSEKLVEERLKTVRYS